MRRTLSGLAATFLLAAAGNAQVIITEVVDGDLSGGNPKFIELSNNTETGVTFGPDDFLRVYFNGGTTANTSVPLDGVHVPGLGSITIASTSNNGDVQYEAAYGFPANVYTNASFGNGDDTVSLERDGAVFDTLGLVGTDGTGEVWEYRDSYARSNAGRKANGGNFDPNNWVFGGPTALDAPTDPERIALLQQLTDPIIFSAAPREVPIAGGFGLGALVAGLLTAGVALQRRRA